MTNGAASPNLAAVMTPAAAYGFLVFNLLCAPCFAAMGAIRREMNNTKWFWFAIGYHKTIVDIKMIVPAFLINDHPRSHMLLITLPAVGIW